MKSTRALPVMFWLAVAIAAALATFVIPFFFPMKDQVFSPAYTAGGNNKLGAMLLAAVSVLTAAAVWMRQRTAGGEQIPPLRNGMTGASSHGATGANRHGTTGKSVNEPTGTAQGARPLPEWLITAASLLAAMFCVWLGWSVVRSGMYYSDSGYFITQLRSGLEFHRTIYKTVEFAYGPLLYYLPALTAKLLSHAYVSLAASYFVSFLLVQVLGVPLIAYTVSALPMRFEFRVAAFLFLWSFTFNPQAGLNYTAFRFLLPCATAVLLAKQERLLRAALVAGLGVMAQFLVSPELALAFLAAAMVYSLYCTLAWDRRWWLVGAAALAGAGVYAVLAGGAYFRTMLEFAKGGYNELLEPTPAIYVLMICAAGLAPALIGSILSSQRLRPGGVTATQRAGTGMLLGLYAVGLLMLSPALGRCDPLHVSFNGFALYLLGFVALDRAPLRWRKTGLVVAALFCMYCLSQEYALVRGNFFRYVAKHRPDPFEDADLSRLQAELAGRKASFPIDPPMNLAHTLIEHGEYQPLYLAIPPVDAHAESRTVSEMRGGDFVLLRWDNPLPKENKIYNEGIKFDMRFRYRYKTRRAPYLQGELIREELVSNWTYRGRFGSWLLFQKLR